VAVTYKNGGKLGDLLASLRLKASSDDTGESTDPDRDLPPGPVRTEGPGIR